MPDIVNMTIGELIGWGVASAAGLSTVLQLSPIKINPWSALARIVGRAINSELITEVGSIKKEMNSLRSSWEERVAIDARTRILRFGDECLHGEKHSKEHFDQILRDITEYENYCDDHPEFENNMAVLTIGSIKSIYQRRLADHDFL